MKILDNKILIEKGRIIAVCTNDSTEEEREIISKSFEMHNAISSFVERIESGRFRPKHEYKLLKELLNKKPQHD